MKRMYRRWAKCEDRYLKEHYTDESVTVRHLADILKRTEGAVARRASQLGLYKSDEYKRQKLQAARELGRNSYGFEISTKFYTEAKKKMPCLINSAKKEVG